MISVSQLWSFLMQWLKRDFQLHGLFTLSNIWRYFIQTTFNLAKQTLWVTEEPSLLGTIFHKLTISSLKIHVVGWRNENLWLRTAGWCTLDHILYIAYFKKIYLLVEIHTPALSVQKTWHCFTRQVLWASLASWWSMLSTIRSESHLWHLCKLARVVKSCLTLVLNKEVPFLPHNLACTLMNLIHLDKIEGNFCSCSALSLPFSFMWMILSCFLH